MDAEAVRGLGTDAATLMAGPDRPFLYDVEKWTYFSTFPLIPRSTFVYHRLSIGLAGSAVMFRIAQW